MRRELLVVAGGNFFYQCPLIFSVANVRCIWFERDEDRYLLLNVRMPSLADRPTARIENNVWTVAPNVNELICPPGGRLIDVDYGNGDKFRAAFFLASSADKLKMRYPESVKWSSHLSFPLTIVELWETAHGTAISFGPKETRLPGSSLSGNFVVGAEVPVLKLDANPKDLRLLFRDEDLKHE